MLLGCVSCTKWNDSLFQYLGFKCHLRSLVKNIPYLVCIVRGKIISSSPSELLTLGSRNSVNLRSFVIPIRPTFDFFKSEFILVRLLRTSSPLHTSLSTSS